MTLPSRRASIPSSAPVPPWTRQTPSPILDPLCTPPHSSLMKTVGGRHNVSPLQQAPSHRHQPPASAVRTTFVSAGTDANLLLRPWMTPTPDRRPARIDRRDGREARRSDTPFRKCGTELGQDRASIWIARNGVSFPLDIRLMLVATTMMPPPEIGSNRQIGSWNR